MLLNVFSDIVNAIKCANLETVTSVVINVSSVIVLVLSALGRIKSVIKDCKDTTKAVVNQVKENTKEQMDDVKKEICSLQNKLDAKLEQLDKREKELDAKLTKMMKKDPISKYKYGEVKEYVPETTTYIAEKVVEEVKEEVEITPLETTTPLPKKKRKAKTSFVD